MKILIISPSWIGDAIMSQTLLSRLKELYTTASIDVYAPKFMHGLYLRMPEVNSVIDNPLAHGEVGLKKRFIEGRKLKKHYYDRVYVLPNSLKSALVPLFAGIKQRVGFKGESRYGLINDMYHLDKVKLPRMVDRFCFLTSKEDFGELKITNPHLSVNKQNQKNLLQKNNLENYTNKIVTFAPGAEYGESKRWILSNWQELGLKLTAMGYKIIILGTVKDFELAQQIIKSNESIINLCGKTSIEDAIDLIAVSTFVVTNDSGLMHVASATNTEVIAIYGSTSPDFTPPLSKNATILLKKQDCSPCFERACKFGHYNCLKAIKVDDVLNFME